jgi:hypothetical protein
MTTTTTSARGPAAAGLPIRIRLANGRTVAESLPAQRHRSIHLGVLHAASNGFVEIAAGSRKNGKLILYTRKRADHFLPAGEGHPHWHQRLMQAADRHVKLGEEVFVGPAARAAPGASKHDVLFSHWLWIDLDGPEHLNRLRVLLARKPAHLIVESAGSGGLHVYWRLAVPLPARTVLDAHARLTVNPLDVRQGATAKDPGRLVGYRDTLTGKLIDSAIEVTDWIERANMRLIHALGYKSTANGIYVADTQCQDRSRIMRLAGSVNSKSGRHARIIQLDLRLAPYHPRRLLGDLADPPARRRATRRTPVRTTSFDAYRQIPPVVYFQRLAGVEIPLHGNISCPARDHPDEDPSCSVGPRGWRCHGCGAGWSIDDLASLSIGGPTGHQLAASPSAFREAKRHVRKTFGPVG